MPKHGIDVHVLTERNKEKEKHAGETVYPKENFTIHRKVPKTGGPDWLLFTFLSGRYVKKLVERYSFDLIHVHGPYAGYFLHGDTDVPMVTTVHGCYANEYDALLQDIHQAGSVGFKKILSMMGARFYSQVEKLACRRSRAVIAVSPKDKRNIVDNYDIPPRKVSVVPHGVSPKELRKVADRGNIELNWERPACLFVGRLSPRKGIPQLLRAWKDVKRENLEGSLTIVGSGPLEAKVRSYCDKRDEVTLLSGVTRLNLLKMYDSADFIVIPSLFEGLPYVLLEALTFGKPVILSSVIGLSDLLEDSVLYVNPFREKELASAISSLIQGAELRTNLSKRVIRILQQKFSMETMVRKTVKVYREVNSNSR